MFLDVRGFTRLSESLPPTELVRRLNRFYEVATQPVIERDGTLDKLVGDQVVAFFGTPYNDRAHERRAVEAALDIVRAMSDKADGERLAVGGAVGTGEAFVGNVGGGETRDYTAIGDVVNTTSRLQGEAAVGELLIMETTYAAVADAFPGLEARSYALRGKAEPVTARVLRLAASGGADRVV